KCRFCNSFLSAAPQGGAAATGPSPVAQPAKGADALFPRATKPDPTERKMLYEGSPSWKAYFGYFIASAFLAVLVMAILRWKDGDGAPVGTKLLDIVIPIALAVVFGFGVTFYRKSIKFRVTNTVIEFERGVLSKRIDVVQLWRVRDVVYKQNLVDRILGIA